MKKWLKISLWSVFGIGVITLVFMTQKAQSEKVLTKPIVKIDVETRKPIARIYNKHGGTYYLDSEGKTM